MLFWFVLVEGVRHSVCHGDDGIFWSDCWGGCVFVFEEGCSAPNIHWEVAVYPAEDSNKVIFPGLDDFSGNITVIVVGRYELVSHS